MDDSLTEAPIRVIETTAGGEITAVNDATAERLDTEPDALRETDIRESFPYTAAGTLREAFRGDTPTETDFEEYYPWLDRWFAVDVVVNDGVEVTPAAGPPDRRPRRRLTADGLPPAEPTRRGRRCRRRDDRPAGRTGQTDHRVAVESVECSLVNGSAIDTAKRDPKEGDAAEMEAAEIDAEESVEPSNANDNCQPIPAT